MNSRSKNHDEDYCQYRRDCDPCVTAADHDGLAGLNALWNVVAQPQQPAVASCGRCQCREKHVLPAKGVEDSGDAVNDERGEIGKPQQTSKAPLFACGNTHKADGTCADQHNCSVIGGDADCYERGAQQ